MVVTECTGQSSVAIGITELIFGVFAVICGVISMNMIGQHTGTTVGLWAFYFAIPGIVCIVAGCKKDTRLIGISLGMNVIGVILNLFALVALIAFWLYLNHDCIGNVSRRGQGTDMCRCRLLADSPDDVIKCSNLTVARNATVAAAVVYFVLLIACLAGSIFGCLGTCCAPQDLSKQIAVPCDPDNTAIVVVNSSDHVAAHDQPSYQATEHPDYTAPPYPVPSYPVPVHQGHIAQPYYQSEHQQSSIEINPPAYHNKHKTEDC